MLFVSFSMGHLILVTPCGYRGLCVIECVCVIVYAYLHAWHGLRACNMCRGSRGMSAHLR